MARKTRVVQSIAVAIAVVLLWLPQGVSVHTYEKDVSGVTREVVNTFSYVDMTLFESGQLLPMITAIAVCALLLMILISFYVQHKSMDIAMCVFSAVAAILALLPLILSGIEGFTPVALTISYLLACSVLFSIQHITGRYFSISAEE